MILESVISFLLTAFSPSEGTAGYPVNVQWTPTYAPADSSAPAWQDSTALGGIWNPGQSDNTLRKDAVHFRWNKYRYESAYLNNAYAAKRIRTMLEEIGYEHVDSVIVTSYASPEGVYEHNQWLAKKRAKEFENVVKKELGLDESGLNVVVRPGGEAWELLRERIVTDENISDVARERILKLLDDPKVGWDTKKWRMENGRLGSTRKEGDLYRWLLVNHYRYLRSLAVDIYVSNVLVAIDGGKVDVVPEEPVMEQEPTQTEPADSTEILFEPEPTLTDEVPEAGVTVNVEPLEYEPIERLDSIVRQPVLVDHERKCALRMPERGEEAAMDEETAETGESAQEQAAEPAEAAPEQDYGPFWPVLGVGTNLLYDLTYIPNYGLTSIPSVSVEYYPESGKYTIGADIEWPNWRHEGEHRFLQIHNIGLWGRYYFKPEQYRFNGFYLGGGANAAMFGLGWNKKGWNGEGIGISAGGGYKWTFGRIYIDVGAALGVFYARYDSYTWGGDATGRYYYDYVGDPEKFVPRSKRWLWLGPTRIQATVGIDLFNRNRRKAR